MNRNLFTKLFAIVLIACTLCSLAIVVSSAADADPVATFSLGANGSASHKDGTDTTADKSYTESNNGYTLSISSTASMYNGAIDAKGNSCLKFGTSSKVGNMSFTVPSDVTSVIIYVAKYKANTTKVTVNGTTYTISGASNNGAYDAITVDTTANKTVSFTTVSGGLRAMVNTIEFYASASEGPTCEHAETTTTTVKPTCHVAGSTTTTCNACGNQTNFVSIPAAHTIVDGTCTECGLVQAPKTGVPYKFGMYQANKSATYYITGTMSGYYMNTTTTASSGVNVYLEETEGGYHLYTFVNGVKNYLNMVVSGTYKNAVFGTTASTVYTYNTSKNAVCATLGSDTMYFGTSASNTYTTVGTTYNSGFVCQFFEAGDVAKFDSASVTLGTDLGMNFKVTVPSGVPTVTVEFAGKTYTLTAEQLTETTYKFAFKGIGPHQMAENIKATLSVGGKAVAEINNYSVEKNLKAILAADASLANIVNAVLAYGNASEDYVGVEGGVAAPEATDTTIAAEENKLALNNAKDFGFTAAGVNFDSANKIYVKFHVESEFKFYVNGTAVEIEKTEDGNYKYYTNELTAKQLGDVFTFEIEVNGVKATLTYSVNTYAYAMQNDLEMSALVKALYAYGLAVKAYA